MIEIIKSNQGLVVFIISLLASIGGTYIIVGFFKRWHEVEIESNEKGKKIEYHGLIISFIALIIALFSLIYSNLIKNDFQRLDNRLDKIEKIE
jgi:uncharacterized membrane protein